MSNQTYQAQYTTRQAQPKVATIHLGLTNTQQVEETFPTLMIMKLIPKPGVPHSVLVHGTPTFVKEAQDTVYTLSVRVETSESLLVYGSPENPQFSKEKVKLIGFNQSGRFPLEGQQWGDLKVNTQQYQVLTALAYNNPTPPMIGIVRTSNLVSTFVKDKGPNIGQYNLTIALYDKVVNTFFHIKG